MWARSAGMAWIGVLALAGCDAPLGGGGSTAQPVSGLAASTTYDGLPILSRDQLTLTIPGTQAECFGLDGQPFPCFIGYTADGIEIRFENGIEGYTFRQGQSATITVDRIDYDLGGTAAPQDLSATRYILAS